MGLEEKILQKLDEAGGAYLSGEALAAAFGVSRAAVWKAVCRLEKQGFTLSRVRNRGYALLAGSDELSAAELGRFLGQGIGLHVRRETRSTNDDAKALAAAGADAWTIAAADTQTAGRGRYERAFYSPPGSGLYMSVLLRPALAAAETGLLTVCAAVAVAEAIEELSGKRADIKWVNDIYMAGKKVCGILTEAAFDVESGRLSYAVVGIGVNVKHCSFPPELCNIAGSVFAEGEYPPEGRARLAAAIVGRLRYHVEHLAERSFLEEYRRRCFLIGMRVHVSAGRTKADADVLGLDDNCFLIVRFDDGSVRSLSAGEVRIILN